MSLPPDRSRSRRKQYREYISSPSWKWKRTQVLVRDKYKCQNCGTSHKLEVHHKTYERFGYEKLDDLETLCKECHKLAHPEKAKKKKD